MRIMTFRNICVLLLLLVCIAFSEAKEVSASSLPSGTHLHHIFPSEHKAYFLAHGINSDLYTIPLDQKTHLAVHKMNYNARWAAFIVAFPRTDQTRIFAYAAALLAEAGVRGRLETYDYAKRKPTGKHFPPHNLQHKIYEHLMRYIKNPETLKKAIYLGRAAHLLASIYLAYECYEIFANLDDNLGGSKYIQMGIDSYVEALETNEMGDEEAAIKKLSNAYFFLGYACFHKMIEYRTEYHKEIADKFSGQSKGLKNKSVHFFKKAISLNETTPYPFYYLGELYLLEDNLFEAEITFNIAFKLFTSENNEEFIKMTTQRLKEIKNKTGGNNQ